MSLETDDQNVVYGQAMIFSVNLYLPSALFAWICAALYSLVVVNESLACVIGGVILIRRD